MNDNQDKFNCKHLTCDMDGCYCGINKGTGYNQCVLPYQGKNCEYFESNEIAMSDKKLKPCPFCGGDCECTTSYLYGKVKGYSINCKKCNVEQGILYKSKQSAINAWNRRVKNEQ